MDIQPCQVLSTVPSSSSVGGLIAILIVLLFLSAFFSMAETIFSSVSESKLKTLVEDRKAGAKKALDCVTNFDRTLTTLLVGNNIVNVAMSVLAVSVFSILLKNQNYVDLVSTLVITILLLIFGEIMPKTLGKKYNESFSLIFGPLVWLLSYVLFPIVFLFTLLQKIITGKGHDCESHVDEDELETILDTMEDEGTIETGELKLIKNVFDLNDHTVEDIMVPRVDMVAMNVDLTVNEAKEIFLENNYSRIPVFEEDKDHIVGILYERDFYGALIEQKPNVTVKNLMKPAKFVNKTMTVDALIHELQVSKMHMAIVSGEYGDTLGLVTMEDALEELVGEIYDEHDEGSFSNSLILKQSDGTYLVDGEMPVDELFEYLEIGDAPEDVSKVSTWVYESSEELPKLGDKMTYISRYTHENEEDHYEDYAKKLVFEIVQLDGRRIEKLKLTLLDATEEELNKLEESLDE